MRFELISPSQTVLSVESIVALTVMTEAGEITGMPHHEPLISALRPGILHVSYYVGHKVHESTYVTGGGVLSVSNDSVAIIADFVQDEHDLQDAEFIEAQKTEAEHIVQDFRANNGSIVDPRKLIEVEYDLLKYTAMHQLARKFAESRPPGTRK